MAPRRHAGSSRPALGGLGGLLLGGLLGSEMALGGLGHALAGDIQQLFPKEDSFSAAAAVLRLGILLGTTLPSCRIRPM